MKTHGIWLFELGLFHAKWWSPVPSIFLKLCLGRTLFRKNLLYDCIMFHHVYMPHFLVLHWF
jgi:hypothetical protein